MEKKGTAASPATALARSVLPVPGGPTSRTPLGMRAPSRPYDFGSLRKDTTSSSSAFASSTPATSTKRTATPVSTYTLALLFPMDMSPAPGPPGPAPPRGEPEPHGAKEHDGDHPRQDRVEPWTLDPAGERDAVFLQGRGELGTDLRRDEAAPPLVRSVLERLLQHALDRVRVADPLLHLPLREELLKQAVRDDGDGLGAGPQ